MLYVFKKNVVKVADLLNRAPFDVLENVFVFSSNKLFQLSFEIIKKKEIGTVLV